ncbi:M14 family metallopeptidase [candidate division KSB1 bacterium]
MNVKFNKSAAAAAGLALILITLMSSAVFSQSASDPQFKVKIDFNRWHDVHELYADMDRMQKAWPKFLKLESIGKSYNGLDIMIMTINNPDTGPEMSKAAMYIEADVHGNEIQGGEVALYTIWYLMENYGRIEKITNLVDERVFYITPTVNPDGHQYFMEGTGGGARTGHLPRDDDNDGLYDEDQPNDLNGNNIIEQIRKYVPGKGTHRISRSDPRIMERVGFGETGDYILLGSEGIDDDGDGRTNEDGPGSYDGNRNYANDWQPGYIQSGSIDYPFQLPESRCTNEFLMAHPNIATAESYHNSAGQIVRGPGSEAAGEYPAADVRLYDELGRNGERIIPFYEYIINWDGMYTIHGGFTDWTHEGLGMVSFLTELWNRRQYFNSPELIEQARLPNSPIAGNAGSYFFDDYLEFGDQFVEWEKFNHPEYGEVEMGGVWKKYRGRVPPRFMLEEMCHRNMAFTLYVANEMPVMELGETRVEKIGGDVYRVWLDITNKKLIPSITVTAAENMVVRPDVLTLDGNAEIISASWITNKPTFDYTKPITNEIDQHNLKRIILRDGHPGRATRTIQYLVKGSGSLNITYDSLRGGKVSTTVSLR